MTLGRRGFLTAAAGALLAACGVREPTDPPTATRNPPDARASTSVQPSEGADATAPAPESPPSPEARPSRTAGSGERELVVLCREAWGAQPAGPGLEEHTITGMMLHHTAVALRDNAEAPARLRQHQRYHQDAGWPDIAYHLGIDRRGNVYELRTTAARGDTFTDYDPAGWLLVTCEGDFDQQEPTGAQVDAAVRAFAWGAATFGVDATAVAGHRDHAATSCPGDALYGVLPSIRRRSGELAGRVSRRDVCGDEAARRVAAIEAGRSPEQD